MIVAHITFAMAQAIVPGVAATIRADMEKAGVKLPLGIEAKIADFEAFNRALSPTTRLWIETLGEFGFQLRHDRPHLFMRGV